jgi:hypothetical protein|tara:strand:+ start:2825 stop:3061 length:237 start_codon:yes stop_codon:yes gene_type:complete
MEVMQSEVDVRDITPEQEFIIARHSRLVGKILDLLEAAVPEGTQCDKLKKLVQVPLYDFRNDMLKLITTVNTPNLDEL